MEREHDRQLEEEEEESGLDLNDTELLLKTHNGYGSIQAPVYEPYENSSKKLLRKAWETLKSEWLLSFIVILFGVAATSTSTFYNILDIQDLNQFWSPCIKNISLSYQFIPK